MGCLSPYLAYILVLLSGISRTCVGLTADTVGLTADTCPGTTNRSVTVPWIQMRGRWLNEVGFAIGAKVRVRVRPGRLVLTVAGEE